MKTVTQASDLVSSVVDIVKGFKWQAEQKLSRAEGYFQLANYFIEMKDSLSEQKLIEDVKTREFLLSACMLSKKSLNHLSKAEQDILIKKSINFNEIKNQLYSSELINRYFLTSGDSLGGVMRNLVGQDAQNLLTNRILSYLHESGYQVQSDISRSGKIVTIDWVENNKKRTIFFDKKPNFLGKSVDFIVTEGSMGNSGSIHNMDEIISCGELKGGVDPAGADEHWKTARSALDRISVIYEGENKKPPELFFIGAAIENSMSHEIFRDLQTGKLTGAANLMKVDQLEEVVGQIVK